MESSGRLSGNFIHLLLEDEDDREEAVKSSEVVNWRSFPMTFELVAHTVSTDSWASLPYCPNCQVPLDLHQPDEAQPSQLLGLCDGCSRWFFLVESELDWEGMLLFELPSAEMIRGTFAIASPPRARG